MLVPAKLAWVPHVKLPVKCPWYSNKFTCTCRQFACILREVLAASTRVNLPVFTGKLHVTQVNRVWGLFTCELQVKLPAFAGNFARASFIVYAVNTHDNFLAPPRVKLGIPGTKIADSSGWWGSSVVRSFSICRPICCTWNLSEVSFTPEPFNHRISRYGSSTNYNL